jgi:tetratricopeptide (TPR) repeat protein
MWERAAHLDPAFSISWRNLGIAYFNVVKDTAKARDAFDRAFNANPADSRVLYERDQLWKRIGERPEVRLAELERHLDLANSRDDLSVELASLYNQTCQHEKALAIVRSRHFQPWEGGEGLALGQHVRTHLALGRHALQQGHLAEARCLFEAALHAPENLGEAKHPLSNQSDIYYWHGVALDASGDSSAAREAWELAATHRGDFQLMRVTSFSELSYYNALALLRIVRTKDASDLLQRLLEFAVALRTEEPKVDYFATSLPQMLLFEDDARRRNAVRADFLEAQARIGLGEIAAGRKLLARVLGADPTTHTPLICLPNSSFNRRPRTANARDHICWKPRVAKPPCGFLNPLQHRLCLDDFLRRRARRFALRLRLGRHRRRKTVLRKLFRAYV